MKVPVWSPDLPQAKIFLQPLKLESILVLCMIDSLEAVSMLIGQDHKNEDLLSKGHHLNRQKLWIDC